MQSSSKKIEAKDNFAPLQLQPIVFLFVLIISDPSKKLPRRRKSTPQRTQTGGGGRHKRSDESQTSCLKLERACKRKEGKRIGGRLSGRGSGAERSGCGERAGSELNAAPRLVMQRMRGPLRASRGLAPRRSWWRMSNNRRRCWIEGF